MDGRLLQIAWARGPGDAAHRLWIKQTCSNQVNSSSINLSIAIESQQIFMIGWDLFMKQESIEKLSISAYIFFHYLDDAHMSRRWNIHLIFSILLVLLQVQRTLQIRLTRRPLQPLILSTNVGLIIQRFRILWLGRYLLQQIDTNMDEISSRLLHHASEDLYGILQQPKVSSRSNSIR